MPSHNSIKMIFDMCVKVLKLLCAAMIPVPACGRCRSVSFAPVLRGMSPGEQADYHVPLALSEKPRPAPIAVVIRCRLHG